MMKIPFHDFLSESRAIFKLSRVRFTPPNIGVVAQILYSGAVTDYFEGYWNFGRVCICCKCGDKFYLSRSREC